ncbi:polymorphic toxin-type HINT domain-containing protein [Streptosporangium sp. NBC_01469]|uniref:polymorphic toxin-type HINT domain-containing protein n=1 Tax=Streptosporangium sp. NBC_01469 TaxID=2903898 RepID=UPI002E2AB4F6|nr:polymorphic toxin-type HINT domain-containing protein [Streptosporangium sp. NBC_01469]
MRFRLIALVIGVVMAVLISGVGVPERLVQPAAAAVPGSDPEPSVDGRAVPKPKAAKGAEESAPVVKPKPPVWPKAGSAEVEVTSALVRAGELPVRIGAVDSGTGTGAVKVQTLSAEVVRTLSGVGVAARFERADGGDQPGKVRAEFSYADFRDGFGGNFAGRLQILRLPACAVQTPRPRGCVIQPQVVKASNDLKAGVLVAEVEIGQSTPVKVPAAAKGDAKAAAKVAAEATAAKQLAEGSVYLMAAGLTGPDGNFGATDLKPSGTWQAGTSGGGFSYDYPLPEAPSPAGNGPDLSLGYDASSVDGQGNWTNNQSSAVGAGWELNAGFIERRFRRCVVDNFYNEQADLIWTAQETGTFGKALCWESPDANDNDASTTDMTQSELVLNLGSRSAQIVKDRVSGLWKTVPDFGWKIEQLPGGADSQAYWKITSTDGQVSRFGFRKDAQWQVPYVGNDSGEPCYDRYLADAIPPTCTGVWRWNLDQEIDADENVIDYTYERETNYFCLPSCFHEIYRVLPYDRGGFLAKAEWGHNTQVAGSVPTARTTLTTADRGTTDVPTDLRCDVQVGCANGALAFYSTRRLNSVLTESLNAAGGWDPVDRLDLSYAWVYTRTDFGAPYDPVLWLDTAQHTGLAGGGSATLPATDFDAVMLAGKMVYDDVSDWTQYLSWRMVPRIGAIANGMGGRVEVAYGQADPCSGGKGRDGTNYHADHTGDCYKVDMSESGNEAWTLYYKQLVTKVTERDVVAASPDMVNSYEYLGTPGWAAPVEYAEPGLSPPSTDWRGYATVRTTQGSGTDPTGYTVTSATFLRGMGGTVTNFEGSTVSDVRALQGRVLQEQSWKLTSLSPHAFAEVDGTRYEYSLVAAGTGPGVHDPVKVLTTRERGRELLANGSWRYTDEKTAYNADGLPNKVNDYGQDGVTTDNSCVSITYARNTDSGQWMIDYPSVTESRAGDDCTAGTLIGKSIALYDGGTDPATNKPTDGNVTESRSYANASTLSVGKATYDDYGRILTSVDPRNKTTSTVYSPAVGWPHIGVSVTNPLGYTTTTRTSHVHGAVVSIVDANTRKTEIDYDALGRSIRAWGPSQPRGGGTPTASMTYELTGTAPAKTTVNRLLSGTGSGAKWLTSHTFDDGFGRQREAQATSPAGGRVVSVTAYDARGLVATVSDPVHNAASAGSGLLNPALTSLPQWSKTFYDGQERPVAAVDYHLGTELRRTTTAYPGADRTETIPPVGAKTVNVLDAFGQAVKVEEWVDATTHHDTVYGYDLDGNLTTITDAKGKIRTFTFDWLGRRTAATDPDAGASSSGYDAAGNLTWNINGKNQKVSYTYDDLGRRTTQWSGEASTGTKLAEWTYDTPAKGRPTAAVRYTGGQAYTQTVTGYDADYRVTGSKVTIPGSEGLLGGEYAFTSGYDAAGNLIEQNLPTAGGLAAEKLTFGYTDLGLPKTLSSNHGGGFTYVKDTTYTATARLNDRAHGAAGQLKRALTWDDATGLLKRVTTVTKADTPAPVTAQNDEFFYDTAAQITRILDAASAVPNGTAGQSECYTYDARRRLSAAFTTTGASCASPADGQGLDPYNQAYGYDTVGNITTLTDNGQAATYTYPTGTVRPNAVTSITRPGGTDTYTYDNAGQMTGRTVAGKQATFDWDELGRLTQAVVDGQQTSMVYDAAGERLIRRDPGGATTLYLGAMELTLAGGAVSAKRYYAAADGSTVALRTSTGLTWMLSGLHGSNQLAVNDATGQISRERYTPFGKRRGGDDLPFTDRGFLGKTEDASTDLTYLSARYYDPAIAKFISTDPLLDLRNPQFANPYSYAGNNPIGFSDPDGQAACRPGDCPTKSAMQYTQAHNQKNAKKKAAALKAAHASDRKEAKITRKKDKEYKESTRKAKKWKEEKRKEKEASKNAPMVYLDCSSGGTCKKGTPPAEDLALGFLDLWIGGMADTVEMVAACAENDRSRACTDAASEALKPGRKKRSGCSSFVPGTKVLMADGSSKPIEKIKVGDKVLATDPYTGKTEAKPVTALIGSAGEKRLVQISVITDDGKSGKSGAVLATDQHPFWVEFERRWVDADQLKAGMWLRTGTGTFTQVSAVETRLVHKQRVHNLTVADIHTYYVLASNMPVLVHNSGDCEVALGIRKEGDLRNFASSRGLTHFLDKTKDGALGAVRDLAFHNPGKRIHVNLDGFDHEDNPALAFKTAYKRGGGNNWFTTEREMKIIGDSVRRGYRDWGSITFYRGGKVVDVPRPDF